MEYFWIRVNPNTGWEPSNATRFIKALLDRFATNHLELRIEAYYDLILWGIRLLYSDANCLAQIITLSETFYPNSEIMTGDIDANEFPCYYRSYIFYRTSDVTPIIPLSSAYEISPATDPLIQISQAMDGLFTGEILSIIVNVQGYVTQEKQTFWNYFKRVLVESTIKTLEHSDNRLRIELPKTSSREEQLLTEKAKSPLYRCNIAVQMCSPSKERLEVAGTVAGLTMAFARPPFNALRYAFLDNQNLHKVGDYIPSQYHVILLNKDLIDAESSEYLLTVDEIAALWHPPYSDFAATKIFWAEKPVALLPPALRGINGILLGKSGEDEVRQHQSERTQHTLILGKPGTGKSTLLQRMIAQDIASGNGVCVIDPHGFLVRDILRTSITQDRFDDVVILDMANTSNPPPLNLLHHPEGISEDIAADMVSDVLTTIYTELDGKEMGETLNSALFLLTAEEQPTLRDVIRLLDNEGYRDKLLEKLDDDLSTEFWTAYKNYSPGKRAEITRPIRWRLNPFYRNKSLRKISCHPNPLDLHKLISEKKIILVSLAADEALIPNSQRTLLGAMLVSQIQMAVMAGAARQHSFFLYIDEAENFVTTSLPTMLAEARKQGLGLILAHQYLHQLAGDTLQAVEGTVGTIICFEVGEPDAKAIIPYLKPQFELTDLIALGKFKAAVSMRYHNSRQPAFLLQTLSPLPPVGNDPKVAFETETWHRNHSVELYTPMTDHEVSLWLNNRHDSGQPPAFIEDIASDQKSDKVGDEDEFIEPKKDT